MLVEKLLRALDVLANVNGFAGGESGHLSVTPWQSPQAHLGSREGGLNDLQPSGWTSTVSGEHEGHGSALCSTARAQVYPERKWRSKLMEATSIFSKQQENATYRLASNF